MEERLTYRFGSGAAIPTWIALAGVCLCSTGRSQTSNTVVANFGTPPTDGGSTFSVVLENRGPITTISGFAFRIAFRSDQAALSEVIDNTSQPQAAVQYGLGDPQRAVLPNNTDTFRVLTMTTIRDLKKAGPLGELVFEKKSRFSGPFCFHVEDRTTQPVDGLLGGDITNINHDFDTTTLQKAGQ